VCGYVNVCVCVKITSRNEAGDEISTLVNIFYYSVKAIVITA
jgi:hypothetical protein